MYHLIKCVIKHKLCSNTNYFALLPVVSYKNNFFTLIIWNAFLFYCFASPSIGHAFLRVFVKSSIRSHCFLASWSKVEKNNSFGSSANRWWAWSIIASNSNYCFWQSNTHIGRVQSQPALVSSEPLVLERHINIIRMFTNYKLWNK